MAVKRYLSKWHSFFWLVVVMVVAFGTHDKLDALDKQLYNHVSKALGQVPQERVLHLLHEGEIAPPEPDVPYETKRIECPTIGVLALNDDDAANCFAALPLGAQDLAVLLAKMATGGVQSLALSAPLTWEPAAAPIARQMLCMRLNGFKQSAIGLRGRTTAEADFTPTALRHGAIPASHVEGDVSGLPSANRPVPNELLNQQEAGVLHWAPDWLDDERLTHKPSAAADRSYPLLVRWNGEVLPTLPLSLAMQHMGCTPKDIYVKIGKELQLGDIVFPLDEHGRTRLLQAAIKQLKLPAVIDGGKESKALPAISVLVQSPSGKQDNGRANHIASTISQLCAKEITEQHIRPGEPGLSLIYKNPVKGWVELTILVAVLIFAVRLLPFLYPILRKLLMLAILGCILWLAHKMLLRGEWFRLSSAILTWLVLAIGLLVMRPAPRKHIRKR